MIKKLWIPIILLMITGCTTQKITTKVSNPEDKNAFAKRYYQNMILKNPKDLYIDKNKQIISLNEFSKADIISILGVPYFIKKEGDMEIWKFFHKNKITCTLSVIWKNNTTKNQESYQKPFSISAYDKNGQNIDYNDCYIDMIKIIMK